MKNIVNRYIAFFIILSILFALAACAPQASSAGTPIGVETPAGTAASASPAATALPSPIVQAAAGSMNNIINGGYVAKQGEWLYLGMPDGLYKIKGSEKQKLSGDRLATSINIVGDWIYYTSPADNGEAEFINYYLYKVKTDGSGHTKLLEQDCRNLFISGDSIYYLRRIQDSDRLCDLVKVSLADPAGSETIIADGNVVNYFLDGEQLYYCTEEVASDSSTGSFVSSVESTIFLAKPDGSGDKAIWQKSYAENGGAERIMASDSVLYVLEANGDVNNLLSVKNDGTKATIIKQADADDFRIICSYALCQGSIYAMFEEAGETDADSVLYSFGLDGSAKKKIKSASTKGYEISSFDGLCEIEGTLYFYNREWEANKWQFYRLKPGDAKEELIAEGKL